MRKPRYLWFILTFFFLLSPWKEHKEEEKEKEESLRGIWWRRSTIGVMDMWNHLFFMFSTVVVVVVMFGTKARQRFIGGNIRFLLVIQPVFFCFLRDTFCSFFCFVPWFCSSFYSKQTRTIYEENTMNFVFISPYCCHSILFCFADFSELFIFITYKLTGRVHSKCDLFPHNDFLEFRSKSVRVLVQVQVL